MVSRNSAVDAVGGTPVSVQRPRWPRRPGRIERVQKGVDIRRAPAHTRIERVQKWKIPKLKPPRAEFWMPPSRCSGNRGSRPQPCAASPNERAWPLAPPITTTPRRTPSSWTFTSARVTRCRTKSAWRSRTAKSLEDGLDALIRVKLAHFGPNRDVLRALLRNGADPKHPLSPFSAETKQIRDVDIAWFHQIIRQSGVRVPRDLARRLPAVLWFFQMGVILFWVTDDSPGQRRTGKLLSLASRVVASLVRLSSLPLTRPLRRPVLELIEIVAGEQP